MTLDDFFIYLSTYLFVSRVDFFLGKGVRMVGEVCRVLKKDPILIQRLWESNLGLSDQPMLQAGDHVCLILLHSVKRGQKELSRCFLSERTLNHSSGSNSPHTRRKLIVMTISEKCDHGETFWE